MNAPRDQRWILRSRELLDQSARQVDPDTLRRLNQIRWQALKHHRSRGLAPLLRWAGAAVAATVLAGVLVITQTGLPTGDAPTVATAPVAQRVPAVIDAPPLPAPAEQALSLPATDLELLQQEADYALLEELEFYAWLEAAEHDG